VSPSTTGLVLGAVLALTAIVLGFGAFVVVALGMGIGFGVGRVVEGKLDLRSLGDTLRGRRSS
jgi:hypothetical protein